jgi:hypothetical protein
LGRESTAGTEVNATDVWRGIGTLLDNRKIERINEDVGIIGGTTKTNQSMKGGSLSMSQLATFEQFLHVLEGSVKTATPSQDGAGTDYIYAYAMPTTSGNTIKTYTIEGGDDAGEEQMLYSFVKDWSLDGNGRNGYQLSANWQARSVEPGTFTSTPGLPTVNFMNFGMTKVYIDAATATYGGTQVSNTVRKLSVKFVSGIEAKETADGRLDFSFTQGTSYKLTGQVEFEHDSTSIAQKVAWRAETAQLIQIKIEGSPAFVTPGTTYSVPTALINVPFKWLNFEKIGEANGNDIVQGSWFSAYDSSAAAAGTITDVVEQATVR